MPIYIYKNDNTGEVAEILQGMNDEHTYLVDGCQWSRVFTVPGASIDTKIDPFSKNDFMNKTKSKKGTLGDLWDTSKELSEKRKDSLGYDNMEKKAFNDYSKKRGGRKSLEEMKSSAPKEIVI